MRIIGPQLQLKYLNHTYECWKSNFLDRFKNDNLYEVRNLYTLKHLKHIKVKHKTHHICFHIQIKIGFKV